MNQLKTVLHDIFNNSASEDLPAAYEPDLIMSAKGGNDTALVKLMYAYGPALRSAYYTYTSVDLDERQGACVTGFFEALYAYDPAKGMRLAATLPYALQEALSVASGNTNVFHVPARTLRRFFGLLKDAGGDVKLALRSCDGRGMTRSTFLLIHQAVQTPELLATLVSMDDEDRANYMEANAVSITLSEPVDDQDEDLLEVAFAAVETDEEQVIRYAYGFETYGDPQTDDEVGHHIGLGRMTVNRKRNSGLKKMRDALGVDSEAKREPELTIA